MLRLVGLARTRIVRNNSNGRNSNDRTVYTAKDEFLSFDIQLASFEGKAAAGSHSFPFSLMLPPGLPSSMKVRRDRAQNRYHARSLVFPPWTKNVTTLSYRREIPVPLRAGVCSGFITHTR